MNEQIKYYDAVIDSEIIGFAIVSDPAHESKAEFFNVDKIQKFSSNDVKQEMTGALLVADKWIPRVDKFKNEKYFVRFTPTEIEKAQFIFAQSPTAKQINFDHTNNKVKAYVFENIIIKNEKMAEAYQEIGLDKLPVGSMIVSVKFDSKEHYNIAKQKGGFSIEVLMDVVLTGTENKTFDVQKFKQEQMSKYFDTDFVKEKYQNTDLRSLKSYRDDFISEIRSLLTGDLNSQNIQKFKSIEKEIEIIDKLIIEKEEQEEKNMQLVRQMAFNTKKINNFNMNREYKFNLSKAIREFSTGQLTGYEKEIHQIGVDEMSQHNLKSTGLVLPSSMFSRQNFDDTITDKISGAGHIETRVANTGFTMPVSLIDKLGVTVLDNLTSKVSIPFSTGHSAQKLAEGQPASQGAPNTTFGLMSPFRFQGYDVFGNEFIKCDASGQFIYESIARGLNNAIAKDLFKQAVEVSVITGHESTAGSVLPTWSEMIEPLKALETDEFSQQAYVMSKPVYHLLQGSEVSNGSGRFMLESSKVNGIPAYGTSLLPGTSSTKYDIVFADWKKSYVGYYGGIELLVDPFTKADNGQVKVTYIRYAETLVNPSGFASLRNIKLS